MGLGGGEHEVDVCQEFGLVNCAIQTICWNRTEIIGTFEQNGSRIKKFRKPEWSDVGENV